MYQELSVERANTVIETVITLCHVCTLGINRQLYHYTNRNLQKWVFVASEIEHKLALLKVPSMQANDNFVLNEKKIENNVSLLLLFIIS